MTLSHTYSNICQVQKEATFLSWKWYLESNDYGEMGRKWKQNSALKITKNRPLYPKCIQNMSKNELKGNHFSKGLKG